MKAIPFPEQTMVLAENQPEYEPLPVWIDRTADDGRMIFCWKLSLRERLRLLFTGKLWHSVLTFNHALQPQCLMVETPFVPPTPPPSYAATKCPCGNYFKPKPEEVFWDGTQEVSVCPECVEEVPTTRKK